MPLAAGMFRAMILPSPGLRRVTLRASRRIAASPL